MKAVKLLNKLQDSCHNGDSLKNIKLIIDNKEISVSDINIYAENDNVKLVIETE